MTKQNKYFEPFTNLFSTNKTLRFRLIPQGETENYITKNGLLAEDEVRRTAYKNVKKLIDDLHRDYIETQLKDFSLTTEGLQDYLTHLRNSEDTKKYSPKTDLGETCRKEIKNKLEESETYKKLFSKDCISLLKEKHKDNLENLDQINQFIGFSTYFTGFFDNRKNMYSSEAQITSIAHRIINENIPTFVINQKLFTKLCSLHKSKLEAFESTDFKKIKTKYPQFSNIALTDIFQDEFINKIHTQSGITFYNSVLGGFTEEGQKKTSIIGLKQLVNELEQTSKVKFGRFNQLKKQILSEVNSISYNPEPYKTDLEVFEALSSFYNTTKEDFENLSKPFNDLCLTKNNLEGIYIKNDKSLTSLSKKWLGHWDQIQECYITYIKSTLKKAPKDEEKQTEKLKKEFNDKKSIPLSEINTWCQHSYPEADIANFIQNNIQLPLLIEEYNSAFEDLQKQINTLNKISDTPEERPILKDKTTKKVLKQYLDLAKDIYHTLEGFKGSGKEIDRNANFYGPFLESLNNIEGPLFATYNKTRNYITQKPYSTEKIKLNFQNSQLLGGWDHNQEQVKFGTLLLKDNQYYLAILHKNHKKVFEDTPNSNSEAHFKKMVYKYLPGPNKMLPKVFLSKKGSSTYKPSLDLLAKYEKGTHKKGKNFKVKDCHNLIDFFKESLTKHPDWHIFNFKFSETESYSDISDFYTEVAHQGYNISFSDVPESYINTLVKEGKLYLFKLHNKDFSKHSKGKPNLFTLYWNSLFDPKNLSNTCMKLSGEAEIFYRKASIPKKITHPKEESIPQKKGSKESRFKYDIIKDKRFTENQFHFHVALSTNFKAPNISEKQLNIAVREHIKTQKDTKIIGIDRGEKNLLYLCVIDDQGQIIHQESLNALSGTNKQSNKTNYHCLLTEKEGQRTEARKDWQNIETIKELKSGYLSQVTHKITELILEHNAIIALEDLNSGFKQSRQKIEKQIYQKFERMLIEKLNFMVKKDRNMDELGSPLKAYQLSTKFSSFQKLGKQSGFIFYIPPYSTSKIDPTTGFIPPHHFPTSPSKERAKADLQHLKKMYLNVKKTRFELTFDFKKLNSKYPYTETLIIEKNVLRHIYQPKSKETIEVDLFKELSKLLEESNINFENGQDISSQVQNADNSKFYIMLFKYLRNLTQIRYSYKEAEEEKDKDYILSPVLNTQNYCFDSRLTSEDTTLPKDSDANGAYHIALKALHALEKIRNSKDVEKVSLAISNKDWIEYCKNKAKGF